jgi:hypothetical protein
MKAYITLLHHRNRILLLSLCLVALGFYTLPSAAHAIACGRHMLTYAVHRSDGVPASGLRCVKVSWHSPDGSSAEFDWYGEGDWGRGSYRHIGTGYTNRGEFGSLARAADLYGNGETFNNLARNLIPAVTAGTWPAPQEVRISGGWNEIWRLVTTDINYTPLPRPTVCGPHFTSYYVTDLTYTRQGTGLRCILDLGLAGFYVWFGAGEWDGSRYSHIGRFNFLSTTGSGAGQASDICDPTFGASCNDYPSNSLVFTSAITGSPGLSPEYRITSAWSEWWVATAGCNVRPFYVIAHRTNELDKVTNALKEGANAVEIDIRYDPGKQRFCVNHDTVAFCDNDELVPFLRGLRGIAARDPRFALLVLDFKDHGRNDNAYRELLDIVRIEFTSAVPAKVILSTAKIAVDARVLMSKAGGLKSNEAFAIDAENDVDAVADLLEQVNPTGGRAYGNGTFRWGISLNIRRSIQKAVALRNQGRFHFVYVWTLGTEGSMRAYLNDGVDGIFVNEPEIDNLRNVVTSSLSPTVGFATRCDALIASFRRR